MAKISVHLIWLKVGDSSDKSEDIDVHLLQVVSSDSANLQQLTLLKTTL